MITPSFPGKTRSNHPVDQGWIEQQCMSTFVKLICRNHYCIKLKMMNDDKEPSIVKSDIWWRGGGGSGVTVLLQKWWRHLWTAPNIIYIEHNKQRTFAYKLDIIQFVVQFTHSETKRQPGFCQPIRDHEFKAPCIDWSKCLNIYFVECTLNILWLWNYPRYIYMLNKCFIGQFTLGT